MSFAAVIFEPVQYQYPIRCTIARRFLRRLRSRDDRRGDAPIRMDLGANPIRNIGFSETYVARKPAI